MKQHRQGAYLGECQIGLHCRRTALLHSENTNLDLNHRPCNEMIERDSPVQIQWASLRSFLGEGLSNCLRSAKIVAGFKVVLFTGRENVEIRLCREVMS